MARTRFTATAAGILMLVACEDTMTETAALDEGLPDPAQSACMAAVANETGEGNVTVLGSTVSRPGQDVVIGVGEDRAPWRCITGSDGTVLKVVSLVDEGTL